MPKIGDMFPSKWLKAEDVDDDQDLVVTIDRIESEMIGQGKDAGPKWVVYFKEFDKGLILNKTNFNVLAKLLGDDDTDDWLGHKVALYATEVEFQGDTVLAIRIRTRQPKSKAAKPAVTQSTADAEDEVPF